MVYNHSGYAISPPAYKIALFHNGMKDGSASSIPLLTLEPGEYMPVNFDVQTTKPNARYELVQPDRIMRNTFEVVPVPLQAPTLMRQERSQNYSLAGTIQNKLKRPFSGVGLLMFYGKDGHLIGSGIGSTPELSPGEKSAITMNANLRDQSAVVYAYEYLIDMQYKNEAQSVSMQDIETLGSATVPNRIMRLDSPRLVLTAAPAAFTPRTKLQAAGNVSGTFSLGVAREVEKKMATGPRYPQAQLASLTDAIWKHGNALEVNAARRSTPCLYGRV
jgi:hypothetical protein